VTDAVTELPPPPSLERSGLIIIDMQNDFVRRGAPMRVDDAYETIRPIRRLAERYRAAGGPVIYTRFIAGPSRALVWNWSPLLAPPTRACWRGVRRSYDDIDGERGVADVIDELAPKAEDYVIDKYSYGAFHSTVLDDILRAHSCDSLVITGTVTHICVLETAHGAFDHGYQAVVVEDAVSSYDAGLHAATLAGVRAKFGWVMGTDDVMGALTQRLV
jgi:nicotinamidase-related amidase